MKKIVQQKVYSPEEAEYYCDNHPDKICYSKLETCSWYGSRFDMIGIEVHLCDECLMEMYEYLKQKFNIEPKEIDLI